MKFPMFALSAIGASLAMLVSVPAFAATSADPMAATPTAKGEKSTKGQDMAAKPDMSGTTRAEVKSETLSADKQGAAVQPGDKLTTAKADRKAKQHKTTKSRAMVKSDAKMARKDGTAVPVGEASSKAQEKGQKQ